MMDDKVVIAFATDHKFRYYTGVTLYSLIQHASSDIHYEILILEQNLSEEDQNVFVQQVARGSKNITLKFIDMKSKIDEIGPDKFFFPERYSIANYYRLFLPEILPEYDKILYLDSDVIVQTDVKELFYTDIGNFPLAAADDRGTASIPLTMDELDLYCYCRRVLGIHKSNCYFNTGVLLMNLRVMRDDVCIQRIKTELNSGIHFLLVDQDVLYRMFAGNTSHLDRTWNFITSTTSNQSHLDRYKIVHFAGVHPWLSIHKPNGVFWWDIAEKAGLADKIRQDVYASPERIKYLEETEHSLVATLNSSCWRLTWWLRMLINIPRVFIKYISHYRNAYKDDNKTSNQQP